MDTSNTRPILIVEDVTEIRLQMSELLNRRGHRVSHAADAEQAIQIAEHDPPLLVLTDMELPGFDRLVSLFREHDRFKDLTVAIVDMNGPKLVDPTVKVLRDYDSLDSFIATLPNHREIPDR